jgi:dTDP-glucose pyrophosphorylase
MAGDSLRFSEAGYPYPKNLVEIDGLPVVEHVLRRIGPLIDDGARLICLVRDDEAERFHTPDVIRLLCPGAQIVTVPDLSSGAASAALLAVDHIDPGAPLLVYNGDQVVDADLRLVLADFRSRELDGGVVVFRAVHPRWSYVRVDDDGYVIEAAEKRPISMLATAGTYYFQRGGDFMQSIMDMIRKDASVEGRFYICPAYNEMVLRQMRIGIYEIGREQYFSLATPQGVELYDQHVAAGRSASSTQ